MSPIGNITLTLGRGFAWQSANDWQDATTRAAIFAQFWSRVHRTTAKACWPFQGSIYSHGYGVFHFSLPFIGRTRVRAHRFAWLASRGPIPAGQDVCHRCDVPHCVNPDHLFIGSHAENLRDAIHKGRKRTWGKQKLNAEQVQEIRALCAGGLSQRDAGARFGVAKNTVSQIITGKTWSHLPQHVAATKLAQGEELPRKESAA